MQISQKCAIKKGMRALGFVGDKFQCAVSTESVRNGWRLVLRTHSLILLPDERERRECGNVDSDHIMCLLFSITRC